MNWFGQRWRIQRGAKFIVNCFNRRSVRIVNAEFRGEYDRNAEHHRKLQKCTTSSWPVPAFYETIKSFEFRGVGHAALFRQRGLFQHLFLRKINAFEFRGEYDRNVEHRRNLQKCTTIHRDPFHQFMKNQSIQVPRDYGRTPETKGIERRVLLWVERTARFRHDYPFHHDIKNQSIWVPGGMFIVTVSSMLWNSKAFGFRWVCSQGWRLNELTVFFFTMCVACGSIISWKNKAFRFRGEYGRKVEH